MPQADQLVSLHFPKGGIDLSQAAMKQPWRQGPAGPDGQPTRIYTTPEAVNVMTFDPITRRMRGGSRAGLKRYVQDPVIAGWIIQHLNTMVGISPGDAMQGSISGRVVTGIAVCQGRVFSFQPTEDPADRVYTEATNTSSSTPPVAFSGPVASSPNNQKLWFVDGVRFRVYTPLNPANTIADWTATDGTLPVDDDNNAPRLITTWRGRIVLSGLLNDSQNWFMSKQSLPRNFDYSPLSQTPTQAVAGNNSRLGFIGDVITALMAYNDDLLLFGGNTSIFMMRGDPMTGGEIDLVTNSIGVAWGNAFTQGPDGTIYFMSNTGAIYQMAPGQKPERISTAIDQLLTNVNTGEKTVTLIYSVVERGFYVFVTTNTGATLTDEHFFWSILTNAWTKVTFANKKHNPIAACTIDGNTASDRVVLIGSYDGYVRAFDPTAQTDDGTPIASSVVIGPLLTKDFDEVKLKSLQAVLAQYSGLVRYSVHTGRTAELALAAPAFASGTWRANRNLSSLGKPIAGHAIYIRITSTERWAIEGIRAALSPNFSKVRRRGA